LLLEARQDYLPVAFLAALVVALVAEAMLFWAISVIC
jgi:hypothetical protein